MSQLEDASWHEALAERDFPADGRATLQAGGWSVLICRVDGDFLAVNNRCTHAAAALSEGRIRRGKVMCPLHGAQFDLMTGRCVGGSHQPLRTFAARLSGGMIEVLVPNTAPGRDELPITSG